WRRDPRRIDMGPAGAVAPRDPQLRVTCLAKSRKSQGVSCGTTDRTASHGTAKNSIYARPTYAETLRYFRRAETFRLELGDDMCHCARCRLPPTILAFGLRLGNALALALEHHGALEFGNGADHGEHQLPSRRTCIDVQVDDPKIGCFALECVGDCEQVGRRSRQAVKFGHDERVTFPHEIERGVELVTLGNRARLLAENLVATELLQFAHLGVHAGTLLD